MKLRAGGGCNCGGKLDVVHVHTRALRFTTPLLKESAVDAPCDADPLSSLVPMPTSLLPSSSWVCSPACAPVCESRRSLQNSPVSGHHTRQVLPSPRQVGPPVPTPGRSSRHHARQVLLSPSRNEQRNNNAVVTILLLYLNWPAIYILYLLLKEYGK